MTEEITIDCVDVHAAIETMEQHLGIDWNGNPVPMPMRLPIVFADAYARDYFPEERIILQQSYQLLSSKGCYYNVDSRDVS